MSDKTASATIASEDKLVVDQRLKTLVGSSLNSTDNAIIHSRPEVAGRLIRSNN